MDQCYMKNRYLSLLETRKFSDCYFLVENEKILSHKLILAASSPVFEAMLYGSLACTEIQIKDILASEFRQMLTFIYTDSVHISSVMNAWALVYVAKKYLIDDFLNYCLNYIKKQIEASNVLLNYEYADLFNEPNIRDICMRSIQMYAKVILNCDYHMKSSTLCNLLDKDELNASEEELICVIMKWASVECKRKKKQVTKENLRSVLIEAGALSRIRFLSLPYHETGSKNIFSKLLEEDEISYLNIYKSNDPLSGISEHLNLCSNISPRKSIPMSHKHGFRRVLKAGNVFYADADSKLTTKIMVNKSVLISGFLLPSRRAPEVCYSPNYTECLNITITDMISNKIVNLSYKQSLMYGIIHTVNITEPLLFEKGKTYDVDIIWSASYPHHWTNEYTMNYLSPFLIEKDVKFEFNDPFDYGIIQGVCYCPI